MAGPSPFLPILVTDVARRDPFDDSLVSDAHPIGCVLSSLANLPQNFGRSSKDDPSGKWAGGIAVVAFPLNYAGNGSLMVFVHPKYGSVSDLAKGWVPTPLYMNFADPVAHFDAAITMGAQDKGEFVYVGVDLEDYEVGSGGRQQLARRTILYRFNRVDAVQTRYIFNGGHDSRRPAPVARDICVTDTNPPFVFFYDGMSVWYALDDGISYLGRATFGNSGSETDRIGQYGATLWGVTPEDPYRPDTIFLNDGTSIGAQGLQVFRSWTAPTFWPELWIVQATYDGGDQRAWDGSFDIYRQPNANAGSTTVPTSSGWDDAWMAHHYSKLRPLPGLDLAGDNPRSLNFRFHRDRHITGNLWVTCVGQYTTHTGDAYQNAWYAKSPDDGKTWSNWTRGQIAASHFGQSTVGFGSSVGWQVAMASPVLSSSNEPIVSIAYSEQQGAPPQTDLPTLYAITFKGAGGATATEQLPYFKRGELSRTAWL